MTSDDLVVGVAVPMAGDAVDRLHAVPGLTVVHHPDLLPAPRFVADHAGTSRPGTAESLRAALAGCDVLLGHPGDSADGLRWVVDQAPGVRWVHATSAGAGEKARAAGLTPTELERVALTTSAGVHAVPLAEFAVFGLLALHKDIDRLLTVRDERSWPPRWAMTPLAGRTVAVLGLGSIGRAVARRLAPFDVRVVGIRRRAGQALPDGVAEVRTFETLPGSLADVDDLVITLPGTAETEGLVDATLLAALPSGAVVVNVGRGSVIDETALAEAIGSGRLRGAVLDVAATEPRDPLDPLWRLPTVIQSPHTAALALDEDARITELFLDNLDRFRGGRDLRNRVRAPDYY